MLKRMMTNSAIYALGDIFVRFSGLLLIPLYTRYLTPEDYGVLSTANTLTAILGVVMMLSLLSAFTRFYFDYESYEERQRLLSSLVYTIFFWASLLAAALWFGGEWFFGYVTDIPFYPVIGLSIGIALAGLLPQILLTVFQTQEQAKNYALWTIASFFITVSFVIYHVVFLKEGAQGSLAGTFIGALIMSIAALWMLGKKWFVFSFNLKLVKSSLSYSLPLVPHLLLIWVMMGSDIFILQYFRPMDEVGIYSLGYTLGFSFFVVTGAFSRAWAPIFYRHAEDLKQYEQLSQIITTMLMLMLLFVSVSMLFLDEAVALITVEAFYDIRLIIPWIGLSAVFHVIYISYVNILFYDKKNWYVAGVTAGAGLLNVLLNVLFIPEFGMLAAAISTMLAYLLQMFLVRRFANVLRPLPYCVSKLLYTCLACVVIYAMGVLIDVVGNVLWVEALKILLVLSVISILNYTGVLRWSNVKTLKDGEPYV